VAKAPLADYVTTQMCFDPDAVRRWSDIIRARGVTLPVLIGTPGAVDRIRLVKMALRLGIGASLGFLRKQRGLWHLLGLGRPARERVHDALAACLDDPDRNLVGFHYYTFNQLADTWTRVRERTNGDRRSHHDDQSQPRREGPDAIRLLSDLGVNSFENFAVDKAKQFVACNPDGYVIGDAILFHLEENVLRLVGRPSAHNWVQYHAETGDYDVELRRDERTAANPAGRRELYRFQLQGPTALELLEKVTDGPLPEVKFFNMGEVRIAGHTVRALHHGMSGAPGLELFGPWDEVDAVRDAIVAAGDDFGLRQVGARVYATNTLESGWIPSPLPAVFTGEEMRAYREWLPADGYEATARSAAASPPTTSPTTT
jgi:hypothetical protein